jgi:hypothetical protein
MIRETGTIILIGFSPITLTDFPLRNITDTIKKISFNNISINTLLLPVFHKILSLARHSCKALNFAIIWHPKRLGTDSGVL